MGRVSYRIKNTFVEFGTPTQEEPEQQQQQTQNYTRGRRAWSDATEEFRGPAGGSPTKGEGCWSTVPETPSPLLHPAAAPDAEASPGPIQFGEVNLPPAFGPQDSFNCMQGYNGQMMDYGVPAVVYDPNTGECLACGWCMPTMPTMADGGYGSMQQDLTGLDCAALPQQALCGPDQEGIPEHGDMEAGSEHQSTDASHAMEVQGGMADLSMCYDLSGCQQTYMMEGQGGIMENMAQMSLECNENQEHEARKVQAAAKSQQAAPGSYTTVMLRNIPNKYTRDMLVKQLNIEFRGKFDFVYLPIDFKNGCNIGYCFINFRSTEVCAEFVNAFDGVDVVRCLPGLHSKKVAEVTPARVQGLQENVQRLRSSPVMSELTHHPEWMPLLLDEAGEEQTFPQPDQAVPPMRPRGRRTREDRDRASGGGGGGRGAWRQ